METLGLVGRVNCLVESKNFSQPRIYSATVKPEITDEHYDGSFEKTNAFHRYHTKAATIKIDTSEARFTQVPMYFVSIQGGVIWHLAGFNAIYAAKPDSFCIFFRGIAPETDVLDERCLGSPLFKINWMAIGE